jgi:3-oxoacyl-[acyl-carrier-protein] synthase-3
MMSSSGGKTPMDEARRTAVVGKSWLGVKLTGVGAHAGQEVMPNDAFTSLVDTNDAWISKRTGIRKRRLLQEGVSLRDISASSATDALLAAGVSPADVDLLILATSSPDDLFGDAASVAYAIGATNAAAFDLTAACSGFVFGLVTAAQFVQSGAYRKVLVVGADALTRFLDWSDRGSCILFGDGAGAVLVEAAGEGEAPGLLGFSLHSSGEGYCNLKLKFDSEFTELPNAEKTVVDRGAYGKITMNGAEVYKFAVNRVRM